MDKQQVKKIELGTFIGLTMALCATVRSIPTLAAVGWTFLTQFSRSYSLLVQSH